MAEINEEVAVPPRSLEEAVESFERREREVSEYFKFLMIIFDKKADLSFGYEMELPEEFSRRVQKMLLANGYLVIYNLVEATMTNLVDIIHAKVCSAENGFESLRRELQLLILKRLRGLNLSKLESENERIGRLMVQFALDTASEERKVFKGNVDARRIREAATDYGFSFEIDGRESAGGSRLLNVKSWRNKLSHGSHSFEECGEDASVDELDDIRREAIAYLKCVIAGVEQYVIGQAYLAANDVALPA